MVIKPYKPAPHGRTLLIIWGIFFIIPDPFYKTLYLTMMVPISILIVVGWMGWND